MRRAIELSEKTSLVDKAGGVFGTVIVDKNGQILAEGANRVVAENDPTWHGEIEANPQGLQEGGKLQAHRVHPLQQRGMLSDVRRGGVLGGNQKRSTTRRPLATPWSMATSMIR